jgi:hypothetical protein
LFKSNAVEFNFRAREFNFTDLEFNSNILDVDTNILVVDTGMSVVDFGIIANDTTYLLDYFCTEVVTRHQCGREWLVAQEAPTTGDG